jgi:hypothetical protein
VGVAEQTEDVVGEELARHGQVRRLVGPLLLEQFAELLQETGRSARAVAPVADGGVGDGEQAHEDVRAAEALPARLAGQAQRLAQRRRSVVGEQVCAQPAAGVEDVLDRVFGDGHERESLRAQRIAPARDYDSPGVRRQGFPTDRRFKPSNGNDSHHAVLPQPRRERDGIETGLPATRRQMK